MEDTHMPNDFGKYAIAITFLLATFYWAIQLTAGEYFYQLSFITASVLACIFIGLFTNNLSFTFSWIPASLFGPLCMKYNAHIANGSSSSLAQISEMKVSFWVVSIIVLLITILLNKESIESSLNALKTKVGATNLSLTLATAFITLIACSALTDVSLMPVVFLLPLLTSVKSFKAIPMLIATAGLCLAIAFSNPTLLLGMLASVAIAMLVPPSYNVMKSKFG